MSAYYNEIDPYAAAWLRNLIKAGHIAPGDVDTRSIEDVSPSDLTRYNQCHFFAGIGVWSHALRRAGVDDNQQVWTGSCPCQPFSVAGQGNGFADERHLWPAFHWLIEQCRPVLVFGEQVASKDGYTWLDLVQADLEGTGYTVGAVVAPAAGFGAPHQRHRMYWVADTDYERRLGQYPLLQRQEPGRNSKDSLEATGRGEINGLADTNDEGSQGREFGRDRTIERVTGARGVVGGLADTGRTRRERGANEFRPLSEDTAKRNQEAIHDQRSGPTSGFWSAADWIYCRDDKYRPVEPIVKQMVDGSAASLGRVCPSTIQEIEKEIAHAFRYQADPGKTMFNLWQTLSADALQRGIGRLQGVHESPVLLAFLRQLTDQGWAFAESFSRTGTQTKEIILRIVRDSSTVASSPHRRELDGQFPGEPTDALRVLSSILARYAQAAWGEAFGENAVSTNPLIVGGISRVGRLRAYGNAICAPQAEEFIKAYLETRP